MDGSDWGSTLSNFNDIYIFMFWFLTQPYTRRLFNIRLLRHLAKSALKVLLSCFNFQISATTILNLPRNSIPLQIWISQPQHISHLSITPPVRTISWGHLLPWRVFPSPIQSRCGSTWRLPLLLTVHNLLFAPWSKPNNP